MSKHPNSLKDLEVRQPTSKKGKTKLGTEQGKKELAMNFFWAQLIFFKKSSSESRHLFKFSVVNVLHPSKRKWHKWLHFRG